MLCADCKYFNAGLPHNKPYGECLLAAGCDGESITPNAVAYASDGESYSARLNVLPSFGCNQFLSASIVTSDNGLVILRPSEHGMREPLDVSAGPNYGRRNDQPEIL